MVYISWRFLSFLIFIIQKSQIDIYPVRKQSFVVFASLSLVLSFLIHLLANSLQCEIAYIPPSRAWKHMLLLSHRNTWPTVRLFWEYRVRDHHQMIKSSKKKSFCSLFELKFYLIRNLFAESHWDIKCLNSFSINNSQQSKQTSYQKMTLELLLKMMKKDLLKEKKLIESDEWSPTEEQVSWVSFEFDSSKTDT